MARVLGWPQPQPFTALVVLALAAAVPLLVDNRYWLGTLTLMLVWMVLNHGWNLVLGYAGVWNFGLLAIYAIGGYTAGLLSLHSGLPPLLAVLLGGVVAGAVSLVLAVPSLRLRGIYVSLLTFSFAEVVRLLIISDPAEKVGGSFGLSGFEGWGLSDMAPEQRIRTLYWIALAAVVLSTLVVLVVARSPLGTALTALRDNPALAAARGVSLRKYQFAVFGLSGFLAGSAGALFAFNYKVISPSIMGLVPLTLLVTMLVIGGLGTVTGPLLGTLIITIVQAQLEQWPVARPIILGLILLVIILMVPGGLVPLISRIRTRLSSWMDDGSQPASTTPQPTPDEETSKP
jgi:branched-chain amino acid transport system permease protein